MRFAAAYYAYLFWLVIATGLFFIFSHNKKKTLMQKFAKEELLKDIVFSFEPKKERLKYILITSVVFLSVIALMRPQWGFQWQEVSRKGLDILIALDTSKSMMAEDVKPNRLERSKLAIKDILKYLKGDRIGLIAFAGSSYLQCPLTVDYDGFTLALDDISTSTIPKGGTSISSAISEAIKVLEGADKKYKILIIITDGEDLEGQTLELAEKAKDKGLKIYCVGIGTKEGELIQITDAEGRKVFLKDSDGNVVKTRLNEGLLEKIALTTGGMYVRSSVEDFGLELIYKQRLSKFEKRESNAEKMKLYNERFQIFVALAMTLLIIEPFIQNKKNP
ncbi:MAG: VWA domain-containing protein [Candidatus Omnitrophica bacterium]|nr:VWA domain-containing protein [Candidatus Omnitrophota bacterium]